MLDLDYLVIRPVKTDFLYVPVLHEIVVIEYTKIEPHMFFLVRWIQKQKNGVVFKIKETNKKTRGVSGYEIIHYFPRWKHKAAAQRAFDEIGSQKFIAMEDVRELVRKYI